MKRLLVPLIAVAALASSAQSLAATTVTVQIGGSGFKPKSITINQGDTVRWINVDKVNHQIVANKGAFASGVLRPGQVYTFTFTTAGGYPYHDALHPSTTGAVYAKGPPPSIGIGVSAPIITYGEQTIVSGTVSSGKPNEAVLVLAQPYGSSAQQIATLMTAPGGAYSFTVAPTLLTSYSVRWKTATSQTVTVQVRPKLTLTRTSRTRLFAKIAATTSFAGRSIYLQHRSKFGQWVTVEKLKLGPNSGRIFTAPHVKGTTTYRVYMTTNQAGTGYLDTGSNSVRVRYRR
jgi:plastocyanin